MPKCNKCRAPAIWEYSVHWRNDLMCWAKFLPYCDDCNPASVNPLYVDVALSIGQLRRIDGIDPRPQKKRYSDLVWLDCDKIINTGHIDAPVAQPCAPLGPLFAGFIEDDQGNIVHGK